VPDVAILWRISQYTTYTCQVAAVFPSSPDFQIKERDRVSGDFRDTGDLRVEGFAPC
jgi:hypothetical protein